MTDRGKRRLVAFVVVYLVAFGAAYMATMRWYEGNGSVLGQIETWMNDHNLIVQLVAVWSMGACFGVWAIGQFLCWLEMRGTYDQGEVGHILRGKKFVEGIALSCVGIYWGLTLIAYYQGWRLNVWQQYSVVVVMVVSAFLAAVYCVRFVIALHNEKGG